MCETCDDSDIVQNLFYVLHDELDAVCKSEMFRPKHWGCVRGVGDFVSLSQYFKVVKAKSNMSQET